MSRGLLSGGRRRKRPGRRVALLLLLVPLVVVAALELATPGGHDGGGGALPQAATVHPPAPRVAPDQEQLGAPPEAQIHEPATEAFRLRFHKPPRAGLVFDLDTGEVLWRLHPRRVLPIASLTKIMTALLVTERSAPGERVLITKAALNYSGTGLGVLKRGRRVRLETLLNGMLIISGNDAAIALAVHVAGTERRFVRLMNRRARALGLRCTRYVDAHGLDPRDHSCAEDLAVLARLAMRNARIARIVRRREASFRYRIKGGRLVMFTHNPLLREGYLGTLGLKTGFTDAAGRCLVGIARRHGHTLGVVLLNSPDPPGQAPKLLNAGFRAELRAG